MKRHLKHIEDSKFSYNPNKNHSSHYRT